MKNKKLVIIGAGEFGEIAYEYFTMDSEYEVAAFAVERKYRTQNSLFGLDVVDFEDMEKLYPPSEYETFVAITYVRLNTVRTRLYELCKMKGYKCATYISSHAFVWHNVIIGENTFIFENSTIQYHARIGNNVILWSGSYVGHRTIIEDNCWLSPHNVISGFCHIGTGCFLGVNATLGDNVTLAKDIVVGGGTLVVKDLIEAGQVYVGCPARLLGRSSYQQFGIDV